MNYPTIGDLEDCSSELVFCDFTSDAMAEVDCQNPAVIRKWIGDSHLLPNAALHYCECHAKTLRVIR